MNELTWHKVPFTGTRAQTGPATWGQRQVWRDIRQMPDGTPYNIACPLAVAAGISLDDVLELTAELIGRHESLRTVFTEEGGLRQRVLASGEVLVGVLDDSETGPEQVDVLAARLRCAYFDHAADVPFRAAVAARDGVPHAVVVCVTHLAADLLSTRLLAAELERMLRCRAERGPLPEPALAAQPLDVAAVEQSASGRRMESAALAHVRSTLSAFPRANFPRPAGPVQTPRYRQGGLGSYVAAAALDTLAARYRVGSSTVALAAAAAMLGAVTGRHEVGLLLVAGNRIPAELRHAVGTLTQDVPALIEVAGPAFSDVIRATWKSSVRAYRHGRFDPDKAWDIIADLGEERGGHPELRSFFNDFRTNSAPANAHGAPVASEFRWADSTDEDGITFFLEVGDTPGYPGAVLLSLCADTTYMPPDAMERYLWGFERLLVDQLSRDVPVARLGEYA
ncbi:condensation domain-containing protein [Nonomuraea sp. NPDC049709]|uniref:condensation domain-containing protein n=1 Tax=Nonomuraea sp. NPDC049709 TaxID=3154736 RepID=UPI0034190A5C